MPRLLILFLHVSLFGCDDTARAFLGPDGASVADDGIVLSLDVQPRTISPGDTARIEVTLRNATHRTVRLEAGGCPIVHYIEDAAGEVVVPEGGDWVCIQILQLITLEPGESQDHSATWTGESCSWVDGQRQCAPLPPGEYRVYAAFRAMEGRNEVSLRTPKIPVRVQS